MDFDTKFSDGQREDIIGVMKKKLFLFSFVLLISINAGVWYEVFFGQPKDTLEISFLNIGQGDAIYIEAPNGYQVLVDGGPDESLLSELSRVMPFLDRSIDMLIVTNPDKDHMAGFIPVLQRFEIETFVESGTKNTTETFKTLEDLKVKEGATLVTARRGMKFVLDEERKIYLEVLFPDRDVSGVSRNDGSIVAKLVYGETSVMLQGDSPASVENYLISLDGEKNFLDSDILKVGHHGSRTSTSENYIKEVTPLFAVISLGADNSYGHPHKEVLETLQKENVKVLRTDTEGRITFYSDGLNWKLKKNFFQKN